MLARDERKNQNLGLTVLFDFTSRWRCNTPIHQDGPHWGKVGMVFEWKAYSFPIDSIWSALWHREAVGSN